MDRWHAHILENQPKGSNELLNEKVLQGIKNAVRTYMAFYQNPNESRIEAFSFDLYNAGYKPSEVKEALDDIKNSEDKLASIAQIRAILSLKSGRKRVESDERNNKITKKISEQMERFENLKTNFIKNTNRDAYVRYVKKYMSVIFPEVEISDLGIDTWGRIALLDFYEAEHNFERAIELGKKRADQEFEKRRKDDYSITAGYRRAMVQSD